MLNISDVGVELFGLGEELVFTVCVFQIGVLMDRCLIKDDHVAKRQRKFCKAPSAFKVLTWLNEW